MERIKKTVELKTSTLILILLPAGVGLGHIEVSTWISVALNIASDLVERANDLATGVTKLFFTLLTEVAKIATSEQIAYTAACLVGMYILGMLSVIVVQGVRSWLRG